MPARMRLRRGGRRNASFFRVVVADARAPRDGRYIDLIGHYNPRTNPPEVELDTQKALDWLRKGVLPTETVRSLLRQTGVLEAYERERDARGRSRTGSAQSQAAAEPGPEAELEQGSDQ